MSSGRKFLILLFPLYLTTGIKAQIELLDSLIHPDSLRHIVSVLAADSLEGRFTGSTGNQKAALFIQSEFEKAGLKPVNGNDGYFQEIRPGWNNVMGALEGRSKPGQVIIFSAHYDHIGTKHTNPAPGYGGLADAEPNDTIFNGANDNASGVSAVISLARYFSALKNNERTILFVAFTGEELGLLGSSFLANAAETDSVMAVINIEMIGREKFPNSRPYITGYYLSDFVKILNRNYRLLATKNRAKEYFKADVNQKEKLFMRSDNFPFALKGVPAHTIMVTEPDDIYYHNENDEPGTLNYDLMKKVVQAIAIASTGLISGADTPVRIRKNDIMY